MRLQSSEYRCSSVASFGVCQGVDGPVAAIQIRDLKILRHCDCRQPLGDRAPLRARLQQAVGQHHEYRVRQRGRLALLADRVEVGLEAEAPEVLVAGGNATETGRTVAGEFADLEPVPLGVVAKGVDYPVQLAGLPQLGDLAETQQRAVGVLAVLAHRLDERQVLVALVAPPSHRLLDEHMPYLTALLFRCGGCVAPTSRVGNAVTFHTNTQVSASRSSKTRADPPKSGQEGCTFTG